MFRPRISAKRFISAFASSPNSGVMGFAEYAAVFFAFSKSSVKRDSSSAFTGPLLLAIRALIDSFSKHHQYYKFDHNAYRYCYAQQFLECFVFHVLSPDFKFCINPIGRC